MTHTRKRKLSFAGMSHRLLLGAEYVDTSSDQDRWNTYWSETADDRETFPVSRPMGIVGGVGINALGAQTVNDFTVDLNDDTRVGIEVATSIPTRVSSFRSTVKSFTVCAPSALMPTPPTMPIGRETGKVSLSSAVSDQ